MRVNTCEMLNKLQKMCWPDNEEFKIHDVECIGYHADSTSRSRRLEGMITISYRPQVPMEQDILVGILLAMYIGNDIPEGSRGSGLKWDPIRNEMAYTACTVTRVSARRTTRGHCRQDIPLGAYDRKQQRWTLKGHHKEIEYLMQMIRRGDDASLAILDKIRAAPWKTRPPNMRQIIKNCGERDNTWEDLPQEDSPSMMVEDNNHKDTALEDLPSPSQTQFRRNRRDPIDWQGLIGSILEEQTNQVHNSVDPPREDTTNIQEALKLMRTLHYDPGKRSI